MFLKPKPGNAFMFKLCPVPSKGFLGTSIPRLDDSFVKYGPKLCAQSPDVPFYVMSTVSVQESGDYLIVCVVTAAKYEG